MQTNECQRLACTIVNYSHFHFLARLHINNTGLSILPDNPGDSRFWTVSPGLQIRVWNLADDRRSLPFFVDSTFWQLNFKHFALFELLLTSNVSSQTPVCHCNVSSNVRKPRGSSDFRLQTSAFRRQTSDLRLYNSNFRLQTWQSSNSGFLISDRWDSMLHG